MISGYVYCVYSAYRYDYDLVTTNIFEIIFLYDFLCHFFLDFYPMPTSRLTVRDPAIIIPRYLKSS